MILYIVAGILLTCLLVYGAFLLMTAWNFMRIPSPSGDVASLPKVSVVIPARNEEASIGRCLDGLMRQDYPHELLEVIVVNDHSEDDTKSIAGKYIGKSIKVHVLDLQEQQGAAYKKAAVAHGIAHASGDIILTTDADCIAGKGWVRAMATHFRPGISMVSGPVLLESDSLFGHLQSLEFMGLIAVGAGSIQAGKPNMCNGANLAYRKDAFEAVGGFRGIDGIASGDDEFLMHRMAATGTHGIAFAKSREAIVATQPQRTLQSFLAQRRRWVSKSTHYERKSITLTLVVAYLAMLAFPVLSLFACFDADFLWLLIAAFAWKVCCESAVLLPAASFFHKLRLLPLVIPEQLLHIPYILYIGIAGNLGGYQWKGRKVN